jgi:demethylmenaquinone methyltransferase/2-methoxy-6-polyprenyl-1,4-benzoquinol methylase
VKAYYHARAREYDDWWLARGSYAGRRAEWEQWEAERDAVFATVAALPPKRTLDVACGTGFVTRLLRGDVVGVDQSSAMLELAREQAPAAQYVLADALELPFPDASFERVFTSHFYGHLEEADRVRFLAEARRVAPELVVFDAALHRGEERAEWQERVLDDGSRWQVYKRFFTPEGLLGELGGGTVLHAATWFVLVTSP